MGMGKGMWIWDVRFEMFGDTVVNVLYSFCKRDLILSSCVCAPNINSQSSALDQVRVFFFEKGSR